MTSQKKQSSITRINLRLPVELHKHIHDAAKLAGGTVTSEILARLEASVLRDELVAQAREIADLKRMVSELLTR